MFDVFLDRDGVINVERADYVKSWDEFQFLPGALSGIRRLTELGCRLFVVTNQAGIHRGIMPVATVTDIHRRMRDAIYDHGGRIDGVFFCPHRSDEGCDCRKPRPGLLRLAADIFQIDLSRAILVGDNLTDIEAGLAVGCRGILVRSGRRPVASMADLVSHPGLLLVDDVWAAANAIAATATIAAIGTPPRGPQIVAARG